MIIMARQYGLPDTGLAFQRDTFRLLLAVRAYYLGASTQQQVEQIRALKKQYKRQWARRYAIRLDLGADRLFSMQWHRPFTVLFRQRRGYRLLDHVLTLHLLRLLYPVVRRVYPGLVPRFARRQAMGIDQLFR